MFQALLHATTRNAGVASSDTGYTWLVQLMSGLTVRQVVEASRRAFDGDGYGTGMGDDRRDAVVEAPQEVCAPQAGLPTLRAARLWGWGVGGGGRGFRRGAC